MDNKWYYLIRWDGPDNDMRDVLKRSGEITKHVNLLDQPGEPNEVASQYRERKALLLRFKAEIEASSSSKAAKAAARFAGLVGGADRRGRSKPALGPSDGGCAGSLQLKHAVKEPRQQVCEID